MKGRGSKELCDKEIEVVLRIDPLYQSDPVFNDVL